MSEEYTPSEPDTWTWPDAYGGDPPEGETPLKCPHCGMTYLPSQVPWHLNSVQQLVPEHFYPESPERCPGSWQNPRNALTDHRRLWKDGGES